MGNRYYRFFALLRLAINNKQLYFSSPGNKMIYQVLVLMRAKGMISGFCLDFERKVVKETSWSGYPKYKVFLKYNYIGVPVIKKISLLKNTNSNFTIAKDRYPKFNNSNVFWIAQIPSMGINWLNYLTRNNKKAKLLARIQI